MKSEYNPPDVRVSAALDCWPIRSHTQNSVTRTLSLSFSVILIRLISPANCLNIDSTCPTRDSNILDHCYTVLKDAYHSVPRAALGLSDHCLVHLLPAYRHKLKSAKLVVRTVKRWTVEAEQDLQACFELTD